MVWTRVLSVWIVTAYLTSALIPYANAQSANIGQSGLPLPRFVSIKAKKANMRVGPGSQYQVAWQYQKRGLPVEIIQEFDNWRKIRDPNGDEGWVHHKLLTGTRTAIVKPWETNKETGHTDLHSAKDGSSRIIAKIEPGVIVTLNTCDNNWCGVDVSTFSGFAEKSDLWGVYPDELIEE